VQLTLTGTLVGLGLGQLVLGPVSDAVGRRLPVLVGTAVHVVASLLCMVAPNVAVLGGLRLVQGLSAAAAAVVATAVVRDLYSGNTAAVVLSRLMLVLGVAPVLAPTVGGELLRLTDWRGVFGALAVLGALLLLMAARSLPETLPPSRRRTGGVVGTARAYRGLLRDRSYVGLVLVAGTAMAALFAYVSGSAFVLQDQYGLTEQQFGLVFGAGAVFLIAATQLNVRLLDHTGPAQVLTGGLVLGVLASAVLLAVAATGGGLVPLLAALWAVLAAVGLVMPNAPALALARHARTAGPPPPCSAPSSSASAPSPRRSWACSARTPRHGPGDARRDGHRPRRAAARRPPRPARASGSLPSGSRAARLLVPTPHASRAHGQTTGPEVVH
jgi:DHA1 family bicyclomycin/chloramphenicol resistance-like MFS transporter